MPEEEEGVCALGAQSARGACCLQLWWPPSAALRASPGPCYAYLPTEGFRARGAVAQGRRL